MSHREVHTRKWSAYPTYKPSGVEWLGEVPEHWEVQRIKHLGSIRYGLGEPPEYVDDGLPFIRATDIKHGKIDLDEVRKVRREDIPWSRRPTLLLGEILVVRSGAYTGDSAIVMEDVAGCIAGYDLVLTVRKAYSPFVAWVLLSKYMLEGQIYFERMRAAQPHLNAEELGGFVVLTPPLAEQRAIAAFLDRETGRIDALVEKKRRQIALLQEKRSALVSHAVTKGLDPNAPMKDSGIEWLGDIPQHWQVHKLGYYVRLQGGYAFASNSFVSGGVPVVRMNNLNRGELDLHQAACIDQEECIEAIALRAGDLLFGMSGSIGSSGSLGNFAVVKDKDLPAQLNQRVGRFIPCQPGYVMHFLSYLIQAKVFYDQLLLYVTGTAQFNVSASQIESCYVARPPEAEQALIATFLDRETGQIDVLGARVEQSIEKLQEFRTALISAAVTGKIDVRGEITA